MGALVVQDHLLVTLHSRYIYPRRIEKFFNHFTLVDISFDLTLNVAEEKFIWYDFFLTNTMIESKPNVRPLNFKG